MSNSSEKELQSELHSRGFYTQKAPASGKGIEDPETGEAIDQADIVAIRSGYVQSTNESGMAVVDTALIVLVIEDKHVEAPRCDIEEQERQQLDRIQQITGADAYFAVKWKHYPQGHVFFKPEHLQDTGKHWKIEKDQDANAGDIDAVC